MQPHYEHPVIVTSSPCTAGISYCCACRTPIVHRMVPFVCCNSLGVVFLTHTPAQGRVCVLQQPLSGLVNTIAQLRVIPAAGINSHVVQHWLGHTQTGKLLWYTTCQHLDVQQLAPFWIIPAAGISNFIVQWSLDIYSHEHPLIGRTPVGSTLLILSCYCSPGDVRQATFPVDFHCIVQKLCLLQRSVNLLAKDWFLHSTSDWQHLGLLALLAWPTAGT